MTGLLKEYILDPHLPGFGPQPIVDPLVEEVRQAYKDRFLHLIDDTLDIEETSRRARALKDKFPASLTDVIEFLVPLWLRAPLWNTLRYLYGLTAYLASDNKLDVFTLNYDCCVEMAFEESGVNYQTGFAPLWDPAHFDAPTDVPCVNLFKLHGSTSWFPEGIDASKPDTIPDHRLTYGHAKPWRQLPIWEYELGLRNGLAPRLLAQPRAIILADENKAKLFPPYITLWQRFGNCLAGARTLVVIGYSWRDAHVNELIAHWDCPDSVDT